MRILLLAFFVGNILAEDLFQIDGARLAKTSSCAFSLKTDLNIDSFALKDPNRFVVDVIGARVKKNDSKVLKSDCVSTIRVGTHPKFVRFVFDLRDDIQGNYKNGEIIFSHLNPDKTTAIPSPERTNTPPTATPTYAPLEPTIAVLTATPTETSAKVLPTAQPTIFNPTPTLVATAEPTVVKLQNFSKEKSVTRIEFLAHGARVTFSSEISFKQTRVGPELFRLFIPGASLGSEKVNHPFFAPQDIPGIVSIVPSESSEGVTLEITVERNTQIFAYRDGNNLEIRKG